MHQDTNPPPSQLGSPREHSDHGDVSKVIRVLLFTDLVDSTRLTETLGDARASDLSARHDRLARDLMAQHGGREIDKSDGFLLLFERPTDAVKFALAYHAALAALASEENCKLEARVGIHLGEILLRENPPEDVARGSKPLEVEGLAKPLTSRVMSLARGRQTLVTRAVFDLARRQTVQGELADLTLSWMAHGEYSFAGIEDPMEIYEVGEKGRAPFCQPLDSPKAHHSDADAITRPRLLETGQMLHPAPNRTRWLVSALALAAALLIASWLIWRSQTSEVEPQIASLVVLPSTVHGEESDLFLTDTIANSLSLHLAKIDGLETKLPPSNQEFERAGRDMNTIAEAYQVAAVVLPTVLVTGDRLQLNLQLVDCDSRVVLWTEDYEGHRDRFLELARSAADGIRQALRPATPSLPSVADSGTSSEAELAFNQGLFLSSQYRIHGIRQDFERAMKALETSSRLQPKDAKPLAEMARLHAARVVTGESAEVVVPEIRRLAEEALRLDPRSGRAWAVVSEAEQIDPQGEYRPMLETALRATHYAPQDPYAQARLRQALSHRSELLGLEASEQVIRLDPLAVSTLLSDAIILCTISRLEEARARVDRVLAIEPDMPFALLVLALVEIIAGDGEAASQLVAQLEPMVSAGRLRPDWLNLVKDYATLQNPKWDGTEELEAAIARLLSLARGEVQFPRWASATSQVAPLLARNGRIEVASELLMYRQSLGVTSPCDELLLNPDLKELRKLAEFEGLVGPAREGLREMVNILGDARQRGEYPDYLDATLEHLLPLVGVPRPW